MAFVGELRPYQAEAVERMVDRGQMLIALVMGAGKTPTTIAAVEELYEAGEVNRTMVVVPTSLKYQWKREIATFTNGAKVLVIDGTPARRKKLWKKAGVKGAYEYVIINPELLINDYPQIVKVPFDCLVCDELTWAKSPRAKRTRAIKRYAKRIPFRFGLTGQPVENRPEELYSIMQVIDPQVLGSEEMFDDTFIVRNDYGRVKRYRNLPKLKEIMSDAMIRKSREDIAEFLPKITRQTIEVDFDVKARDLYIDIAENLADEIRRAMKGGNFDLFAHYGLSDTKNDSMRGDIMAKLTFLRMLCDSPQLVIDSALRWIELADEVLVEEGFGTVEQLIEEDGGAMRVFDSHFWWDNDLERPKFGSAFAAQQYMAGALDGLKHTPKLDVTVEEIETILNEDPKNKVVLFSTFKGNLREIARRIEKSKELPGVTSVLFHGEMNGKQRDVAKQEFANNPNCRVFLSSDAGGYGVNLPNANYLISYDLPWSAGKLDQREARIDRLSSEFKAINLLSIVMYGSIEMRQAEMLEEKRNIGSAFLDGKHDKEGNLELSMKTLSEFLEMTRIMMMSDEYQEAA